MYCYVKEMFRYKLFGKIDLSVSSMYRGIVRLIDRNRHTGSTCRNNYGFLLESARSIFLSTASCKFIHYTGPAVPDSTGSDSWTANPIEDSCAPQQQIKSYFIPLPAKILSLPLSHSPSFSRPLFLFPRRKLVHQSSPAPIFLLECCCRCPILLTPPVSLSWVHHFNPPLFTVNHHIAQLPPFAALPTATHSTPSCIQLINFCTEL